MDTNIETIILDDGIKYAIVEEIEVDNISYTMFANLNDETDICFRKKIEQDGSEYYVGLENKDELEKVIMHFTKNILKNNS